MEKVYLSTGSNLDRRLRNLDRAIRMLDRHARIKVLRTSTVYETEPWGYHDQPAFLNQVLEIETDIPPEDLLIILKSIEKEIGRTPTFKNGPRVIDIDIIFYGNWILETDRTSIPHPQLNRRAFVLVPLAELIHDFIHPQMGRTVGELLAAVDTSGVKRFSESGQLDG